MKWNTPLNMGSTYARDRYVILIPELQIFMIPIPILIPPGLIPILITIPGFTKIHDSDSSSKWFQFWLQFQCFPNNLIPILILIPASCDSDSNPIPPSQALIPILIPIPESFTTLS